MPNFEIFDTYWRTPFITTWYPPNAFESKYAHVPPFGPIPWRHRHASPGHVNKPMEFWWPMNGVI